MFVSVLTQHRIQQVSFSIYGSIEISQTATDLDVCFVQILGLTCQTSAFGTKIFTDQWCEPELPHPYRLVSDFETSLQKKFSDVTESELVSQSPENCEQNNVVRELEIIERCA
jgi:hypothetical protein